jgi:hypothetical protein
MQYSNKAESGTCVFVICCSGRALWLKTATQSWNLAIHFVSWQSCHFHAGRRIRYSSLAVVLCKLYCSSNYRTQANKHGLVGRGISTEHRKHTCSMNFFLDSWQWGSITMVLFRVVIDIAHEKESFCRAGTRVVRKTKKDGLVNTGIQPIKWIMLSSRMLCRVDWQTRNFVSEKQQLYPLRWYHLRSNMASWSPRSPPNDPQIKK